MIAFIGEHLAVYGVEPICRVLPIAPSTYYTHVARHADPSKLPARSRSDATLNVEIRRVFEANFRVCGVCKIWRQLGREGIVVARCAGARLMRIMGLQGAVRGKPRQCATMSRRRAFVDLNHLPEVVASEVALDRHEILHGADAPAQEAEARLGAVWVGDRKLLDLKRL